MLSVHHNALKSNGDCTLILAIKEENGAAVFVRAILIDGGFQVDYEENIRFFLNQYLPGGYPLNALVVTHYDKDHVGGITAILKDRNARLANGARLYDQGKPNPAQAPEPIDSGSKRKRQVPITFSGSGENGPYNSYKEAIEKRNTSQDWNHVNRVSQMVLSLNSPEGFSSALTEEGYFPAPHLIGQEILWGDGAPPDPLAPTVEIVAANAYVKVAGGAISYEPGDSINLQSDEAKNRRSLGLLLRFRNFKYFIGGDMESSQEDKLAGFLGNVDVLRTSHHGSDKSTSKDFLNDLSPAAAIISCGWGTKNKKPDEPPSDQTIFRLVDAPSKPLIFFTNGPWAGQIDKVFVEPNDRIKFRVSSDERNHGDVSVYVHEEGAMKPKAEFEIEFFQGKKEEEEAGKDVMVDFPSTTP
ncbi:MAG TPA: hypothetical protein DCR93_03520 [Cytophagales bacterium]|nr:hypothetical protein [Cytophagales bacterium]